MKKIEQLFEYAQNDEPEKFKDAFNTLCNSLNVWEINGGTPSEAVALICGNLIDRYDDLLTVIGYYWKVSLTSDELQSPSSDRLKNILKTCPTVIGAVQQNYTWEHVLDVCNVFLKNADQTSGSPIPQKVITKVLTQALGKFRNTQWLESMDTLRKVVGVGNISTEAIVVTSVQSGNDQLLSAIIELNGIKPLEAIYVASEWSEKLAESLTEKASKFASGKKSYLRMFPIVYPFVNVEQILDCAREDNKNINLGNLRQFIKRVDAWNGLDPFSPSSRNLQQIDLIFENLQLPAATKHENLLNKLVVLCADKYPQAQNWRNLLDRHKILQEVEPSSQTSVRKI